MKSEIRERTKRLTDKEGGEGGEEERET